MIVLGFDTATPATAVALGPLDGELLEERDDPGPKERPGHTTLLLECCERLLARARLGWESLERIAIGVGPGGFTGLRIGVATAQGLARSLSIELVGVSTLQALAHEALSHELLAREALAGRPLADAEQAPDMGLLAVLDARRGEAFVAAYLARGGSPESAGAAGAAGGAVAGSLEELVSARAVLPDELAGVLAEAQSAYGSQGGDWLAVGDGAIRFRRPLVELGCRVATAGSPLHLVRGRAICELGALVPEGRAAPVLPAYGRRPDAEIALEEAIR